MSGTTWRTLRVLSTFLIIAALVVPRLTTMDTGVWALGALMLGIALLAGTYYRRQQDPAAPALAEPVAAAAAEAADQIQPLRTA